MSHSEAKTPGAPPRISYLCLSKDLKWQNGSKIRIYFLNGDPILKNKTFSHGNQWFDHINLSLEVVFDISQADVRVKFMPSGESEKSHTYIGTACLDPSLSDEPTMILYINENTSEDIFAQVVLHEFGHVLSCVHEHQSPKADIKWNKEAVRRDYPEHWTLAMIEENLFYQYNYENSEASEFDHSSIMTYPIRRHHTMNHVLLAANYSLSVTDKQFISQAYPKSPTPLFINSAAPELNTKPGASNMSPLNKSWASWMHGTRAITGPKHVPRRGATMP
ncbi:hypothetical protein B7463_g3300, partial [Scytalidium lignicola]